MVLVVKHTIQKPSGLWLYRRYWPKDVAHLFETTRFLGTLGYENTPGFSDRHTEREAEFNHVVAQARRQLKGDFDTLDAPTIAYLAEAFRQECLEQDEEGRWSPDERDLHRSVGEQLARSGVVAAAGFPGKAGQRWATKRRETLELVLPHYRSLRAHGDLDELLETWRDEALDLADAHNVLVDPKDNDGLLRLCRALNDAALAAGDGALRRLDGEDVPTPPEPVAPPRKTPENPTAARVPLLATYNTYAKSKGIRERGRRESRAYLAALIDFIGHDDAAKITFDDLRRWRDALLAETTSKGTLRDPKTVKTKYISAVKATLGYAKRERLLPVNVAEDLEVIVPRKPKTRERSFTQKEATAILTAALGPHSDDLDPFIARARRWVPWLCAYTGARVNEITQLRREDVFKEDGIWAIRITPEAGDVKTDAFRDVPLHPHLIEQGFVEIVEALPEGYIFYDPSRQKKADPSGRYSKKPGERLAHWVRHEVGVDDPRVPPNHGWRHLWNALSYGVMEERMADVLKGHAPATTGRKYAPPAMKDRAAAVACIPRFEVEGA